jgi:hypothetical protein
MHHPTFRFLCCTHLNVRMLCLFQFKKIGQLAYWILHALVAKDDIMFKMFVAMCCVHILLPRRIRGPLMK